MFVVGGWWSWNVSSPLSSESINGRQVLFPEQGAWAIGDSKVVLNILLLKNQSMKTGFLTIWMGLISRLSAAISYFSCLSWIYFLLWQYANPLIYKPKWLTATPLLDGKMHCFQSCEEWMHLTSCYRKIVRMLERALTKNSNPTLKNNWTYLKAQFHTPRSRRVHISK